MFNQITDRLQLVESRRFQGIPFISHSLAAIAGFSQEVFRGDIHLGSVGPYTAQSESLTGPRVKVRSGDVIYRVNLSPQTYEIVGTLTTRDKYTHAYELPIVLRADNSFAIAQEYQRGRDPVRRAVRKFKDWFEHYAAGIEHDQITSMKLPFDKWNVELIGYVGIKIIQTNKPTFQEDPKWTEALTLQHETEMRHTTIQSAARIRELEATLARREESKQNEHVRQEDAKRKAFNRQEQTKDHIQMLRKNFRQVAADELNRILKERIHEGYETARPMEEISQEYVSLLDVFEENFHIDRENTLFSGAFQDSAASPNTTVSSESTTILFEE